jgi:hypothetical protein
MLVPGLAASGRRNSTCWACAWCLAGGTLDRKRPPAAAGAEAISTVVIECSAVQFPPGILLTVAVLSFFPLSFCPFFRLSLAAAVAGVQFLLFFSRSSSFFDFLLLALRCWTHQTHPTLRRCSQSAVSLGICICNPRSRIGCQHEDFENPRNATGQTCIIVVDRR